MDFQYELNILLKKLNGIENKNKGPLDRASRSIIHCYKLLWKFKKEITSTGFQAIDQEIEFFKNIKQFPFIQLIYFSEIRSLELQYPRADNQTQLKFIKKKIDKLNRFFLLNLDFGQYVESGATDFDREYYTRQYLDSYYITSSKFYFQDPDFSTPRDMLLAKFNAYKKLIGYLDKRLYKIEHGIEKDTYSSIKKIPWTFSHADWVELIYALHAAAANKNTQINIADMSEQLQQVFDYSPPRNIYHVYQEIKNRKQRSIFLNTLQGALLSEMNESEE